MNPTKYRLEVMISPHYPDRDFEIVGDYETLAKAEKQSINYLDKPWKITKIEVVSYNLIT